MTTEHYVHIGGFKGTHPSILGGDKLDWPPENLLSVIFPHSASNFYTRVLTEFRKTAD